MSRDHFAKVFKSPYFQSEHYKNDSESRSMEKMIEKKIKSILKFIKK
jgi:hypothetical protein